MMKIIFLVLIVIVAVIAVILVSLKLMQSNTNQSNINNQAGEVVNESTQLSINAPLANLPKLTPTEQTEMQVKNNLKRIAAAFVERFGSYSNQGNFANVQDLKVFMSPAMEKWADTFVAQSQAKVTAKSPYYSVVTQAVLTTVTSFDQTNGQAEVLVSTRRREATSSAGNVRVFNQDMTVQFINTNGAWLVDGAQWKK